MNDKPKIQVLTAGGAGRTPSSTVSHRGKATKQAPQKTKSVSSSSPAETESHASNIMKPLMSQNHPKGSSGSGGTTEGVGALEYEIPLEGEDDGDDVEDVALDDNNNSKNGKGRYSDHRKVTFASQLTTSVPPPPSSTKLGTSLTPSSTGGVSDVVWLIICFVGIMASFVCYGLLLEYTTSGGRKLHELSFLFITSALYTITAAAGRYVRDETPTTIPPRQFALLGLTSMGSTWCSVRSLRYVIFPIQVLAKSCKPVPVMLFGAVMGKKYNLRKYINVCMIVLGVALFMGGGNNKKKEAVSDDVDSMPSGGQLIGVLLLFISLCFDGGTGAYEDKLMSVYSVQPFDLMFNIQLGKTILAGIGLLVFNQLHIFLQMISEMGFLLVALGFTGALGQVFIFVTIAKFGALTCSIIGLARKVTTLVASIYFYGHTLNSVQMTGLAISIASMVMNFMGKKKKGDHGHGHGGPPPPELAQSPEEVEKMLREEDDEENVSGDVELASQKPQY